jgi:hypothetical protein
MKIYLAGKIAKGDEIGKAPDWRSEYTAVFGRIADAEIISPEDDSLDESQPIIVFGHDCSLIQQADVLVINASTKLGVGTAQEMLIAKYFNKPVVVVLPKNTHHRRSDLTISAGAVKDWIHPFVFSTSDAIVESVEEAANWLAQYIEFPKRHDIKNISVIDEAIKEYRTAR